MIRLWKESLLPGTMVDPRSKRRFTITEEDVKAAKRNIKRMLHKGLTLPLVWEHQDVEEADPEEWKANYARNTFGRAGGARLSTTEDVDRGIASYPGTLLVRHDVFDEKDAAQLKKTGRVSPKIYRGYLDSTGEEYEGVTVAHIASTPTAVQFWQKPFEMSESDAVYLSYTPPSEDDSCPPYTETFSEWLDRIDAVILSATADPDEDEPVAEEDMTKKKADGDTGGNADLKAIIKALKEKFGAKISDKVSNWSELLIAIESNMGGGGDGMDMEVEVEETEVEEETNPDEDMTAAADAATTGGAPMIMSTTDRDPKKRSRAQKEAKPERDDAVARVNSLLKTGRIDAVKSRALLRRVGQVEMSFSATGEAGGKRWLATLAEIATLEKAKPNSAWQASGSGKPNRSAIDLSTTEADRPKEVGTMSAERSAEVTKFILGEIPIQAS